MAVLALDTKVSGTASVTNISTTSTINITIAANSKRILIVNISALAPSGVTTVSNVAIGGTNFTKAVAKQNGVLDTESWYLINPPSGAQTITITYTGLVASATLIVQGAISIYNADQTNGVNAGTVANNSGSGNPTVSITPSLTQSWIIDNVVEGATGVMTSPSNTQNWSLLNTLVAGASQYNLAPNVGSNSLSWTAGSGAGNFASVAIEVLPSDITQSISDSAPFTDAITAESIGGVGNVGIQASDSPLFTDSSSDIIARSRLLGGAANSIAFDTSVSSPLGGSHTSFTQNITIANNPNRILFAVLGYDSTKGTPTSVKIGSTLFTLIQKVEAGGADSEALYCLLSPPTGVQTVTVNLSASQGLDLGLISFYNVDQITGINFSSINTKNTTGANPSIIITPTNINSWLLALFSITFVPSSPSDTEIYRSSNNKNEAAQYKSNPVIGSGNTISYTAGSSNYTIIGVEILPFNEGSMSVTDSTSKSVGKSVSDNITTVDTVSKGLGKFINEITVNTSEIDHAVLDGHIDSTDVQIKRYYTDPTNFVFTSSEIPVGSSITNVNLGFSGNVGAGAGFAVAIYTGGSLVAQSNTISSGSVGFPTLFTFATPYIMTSSSIQIVLIVTNVSRATFSYNDQAGSVQRSSQQPTTITFQASISNYSFTTVFSNNIGCGIIYQTTINSIPFTDSVSKGFVKSITDSSIFVEYLSKAISKIINDTPTISENSLKNINRQISETVIITDNISKNINKMVVDNPIFLESVIKSFSKQVADNISLNDSTSKQISKIMSDNPSIAEAFSKAINKSVIDSLALSEFISGIRKINKLLTQTRKTKFNNLKRTINMESGR